MKYGKYLLPFLIIIGVSCVVVRKRMNINKTSGWITYVKEATAARKAGQFAAQDKAGEPIILEWTVTDVRSPNFSVLQKDICAIVAQAFAHVEIQFLKVHPELHDEYCQSFEPLFKSGPEADNLHALRQGLKAADWQLAEEKMRSVLKAMQLMDYSNFGVDDVHIFVLAKDGKSKKLLGYATFYIMPGYPDGDVKISGIALTETEQNRGLGKLLMSSVLKIVPKVKRIINSAHPTNDTALRAYQNWGFVSNPNPIAEPHMPINKEHWVYLVYNIEQTDILQKAAKRLGDLTRLDEAIEIVPYTHAFKSRGDVMCEHMIDNHGIEIFTESFGKKSDPAILLISGAMASARFWIDEFCQQLADEDYFVIRYDHRDMGLSSAINYAKDPYTLNDLVKDATAVLDGYNITKAHIVGHSMGGAIAQLMALDYPMRVLSITLISSSVLANVDLNAQEKEALEKTWAALSSFNKPTKKYAESVDGFMHSYAYLHGDIPMEKTIANTYIQDMYERSKPEHLAWFERYSSGVEPLHNHVKAQQIIVDRTKDLKKLTVPALVIHGQKDCLAFPRIIKEYCVDLVPNATMHIIPGMGHMILNKNLFKKIENQIIGFIRGLNNS